MLKVSLLPIYTAFFIFSRTIKLFGIGESEAAEKITDLLDGEKVATDGFSIRECSTKLITNAPDGSRDYNDKTDWEIVSL